MKHSIACTSLVKRFEGCILTAYPDPATKADPWTCGYGATGCDVTHGVIWTQAQAEARLEFDLASFDDKVSALIGNHTTSQHQFDALVSFAFNVGAANLASSTLLKMHKAGNYVAAAKEFARWSKAAGKTMPGLIKRRAAEAVMYRGEAA